MRFIMITVLIDMFAVGMIVPVLPALFGSLTTSPTEQSFWTVSAAAAFGLANFFGASVLGALSDRYGRRPVLLLGFCGFALSFFATALASTVAMAVWARALGGALQANAAVANAYVADITKPEDRARQFGMLGAMFGVGFTMGPALGGFLAQINLHWPFWVAGGLAVLNLIYGLCVLPESLPAERRAPVAWWRANPWSSFRSLARLQGAGPLVVVLGLSALAQFILHSVWGLHNHLRFHWGPLENGLSLFVVGLASVLVQGVLLRRLLARWGAAKLTRLGLLSGACAYLLWGLANQGWMMFVVIIGNVLGFSAASALQSMISNAAEAHAQGQTLGAISAVNSLMLVLAPLLGGSLFTMVSHLPSHDWRLGSPFFLCALLQALALCVAIWHFTKQPDKGKLAGQAAS